MVKAKMLLVCFLFGFTLFPSSGGVTRAHGVSLRLIRKPRLRAKEMFLRDELRFDARKSNTTVSIPLNSLGEVEIDFGTPAKTITLDVDTGSDLTWIQCERCDHCYQQGDPIFTPSDSTTYQNLSCNATCTDLNDQSIDILCELDHCIYETSYLDNTTTKGNIATDSITLDDYVIPNYIFGCSHNLTSTTGPTSGLLGLGQGDSSFMTQTLGIFENRFSYCIPLNDADDDMGYLQFGNKTPLPGSKYIPMIFGEDSSLYYAKMSGIRVNLEYLLIDEAYFKSGIIIDSGTYISRLPEVILDSLVIAVEYFMREYTPAPPEWKFGLCYYSTDFSENDKHDPMIEFVFQNETLRFMPDVVWIEEKGKFCLAFVASNDNEAVLGGLQQQLMDITFDIPNRRFGIAQVGECGNVD